MKYRNAVIDKNWRNQLFGNALDTFFQPFFDMKKLIAFCPCILFSFLCMAQEVFLLQDPGKSLVVLDEGWTYQMGDHPEASRIDYDGRGWKPIHPNEDIVESIPADVKTGIGWMRLRFRVASDAQRQQLAIMIRQVVASEIYLNGKSIARYGVVSTNPSDVVADDPLLEPVQLDISNDSIQVLAVRFAVQPGIRYAKHYAAPNLFFSLRVVRQEIAIKKYKESYMRPWQGLFMQGIIFMVFIVHFSFFIMLPVQRANLYFAVAALFSVIASMTQNYYDYGALPDQKFFLAVMTSVFYACNQIFMFTSIHTYLKLRTKVSFWVLVAIESFGIILAAVWYRKGFEFLLAWMPLLCYLLIIFISGVAQKRQVKEATILTVGFGVATVSFLIFLVINIIDTTPNFLVPLLNPAAFVFLIYTLAPPAAVSIFLAYDFARTSTRLQDKLYEIEILSKKNVAAQKEKQELLASQNTQLEAKVHERTAALNHSLNELKSAQSQLIQSAKMASLGELTAGIAHEIQNPLNFVNNFSEVNTELIDDAHQEIDKSNFSDVKSILNTIKDNEEKINHHGKRADAIVKAMLQHSRSSTGTKEPTDINALAYEYLRLAFHGWRAKDKMFDVHLVSEYDQAIMPVDIVRQDIGRVILNLINNAFYTVTERKKQNGNEYEPTVFISTKKSGHNVVITVKDNGNGIPLRSLDKIFHPFFTTKPVGKGTGLGLSLSYDIVKAHNGELKVITKEGEGSEFLITLPVNT